MSPACPASSLDAYLAVLDYTDLRKDVTYDDIEVLCLEARTYGVTTVIVPSALVGRAARSISGAANIGCPISYPFGTQAAVVKAREAEVAISAGAAELDIVPHFGALRSRRWKEVSEELRTVAHAAPGATLKLVLEVDYLDDEVLERVCALAQDTGFAFVSNTIGFRIVSTQPETAGAASVAAVRRLARFAGTALGVKAVGEGRTLDEVARLRDAGASRMGVAARRGLLAAWVEGGSR